MTKLNWKHGSYPFAVAYASRAVGGLYYITEHDPINPLTREKLPVFYTVEYHPRRRVERTGETESIKPHGFKTADEAKAAAEADHEARRADARKQPDPDLIGARKQP